MVMNNTKSEERKQHGANGAWILYCNGCDPRTGVVR
jgi:hypothetical protein